MAIVVAHGFTGLMAPAGRTSGRGRAVSRYGGVVSFDFRGHGGSGGPQHRRRPRGARPRGGGRLGPRTRLRAGRHARFLDGRVGGGAACRPARRGDAVVAVSGPSRWYYRGTVPMRRVHWVIERRLGRLVGRVALRTRISSTGWDPCPRRRTRWSRGSPRAAADRARRRRPLLPGRARREALRRRAEPKELWIEPGFGHAENAAPDELVNRIATWLTTRP